jgi:hypothetical protein
LAGVTVFGGIAVFWRELPNLPLEALVRPEAAVHYRGELPDDGLTPFELLGNRFIDCPSVNFYII